MVSSKVRTRVGFPSETSGTALFLMVAFGLLFAAAPAFAGGGACPSGANYVNPANPTGSPVTLSSLGITTCYYVSKSAGSDSNSGTSEASPWAHLPGMPSCTGTCASAIPSGNNAAAEATGFILKGGDTWVSTDLDVYWIWYGTAGAPVYIGVDPGWPATGWTRPIWTCVGAACSYTANGGGFYTDWSGVQYVTLDNIEMTGLYSNSSAYPLYYVTYGSNNIAERLYVHGWSHDTYANGTYDDATALQATDCCGGGLNDSLLFNVVDGSDTAQDSMACFPSGGVIAYSVCKYATNGVEGAANSVHDNLFSSMVLCFVPGGCHQNAIQQSAPVGSNTNVTIYNNVITGIPSGGMVKIWTEQSAVNNGSIVTYTFNNVLYGNQTGNDIDICQEGTNCGTHYFFNNTFECDPNVCSAPGGGGPTTVVYWANNHCITSNSNGCFQNLGTNVTATLTTNLTQTISQASAQGYTPTSTYAFQPTSGSGGTVGTGTNYQSYCTAIQGFDTLAGAACTNSTSYACGYNTSNHTVSCPDEFPMIARPATATWDIGAYEYQAATPPGGVIGPKGIIGPKAVIGVAVFPATTLDASCQNDGSASPVSCSSAMTVTAGDTIACNIDQFSFGTVGGYVGDTTNGPYMSVYQGLFNGDTADLFTVTAQYPIP
jgi:hypothetical protein